MISPNQRLLGKTPSLALSALLLVVYSIGAIAQTNPLPFINQPLVPTSVRPGSPDLTLTVNGSGFVPSSVVNWDGSPLPTTFVNNRQLKAAVPSSSLTVRHAAWITVSNPAPGGGRTEAAFFEVANPTGFVSFLASNPPVGHPAGSVTTADFDGDRNLDIALTGSADVGVDVLLGRGDGTFSLLHTVGNQDYQSPGIRAARDFNSDGLPDVLMSIIPCFPYPDCAPQISEILMTGNGDGTFQPAGDTVGGADSVGGVVVGDVNGDGKLDMVVTARSRYEDAWLTDYFGIGDGTFSGGSSVTINQPYASSPVVGDFNGDSILDVAVPNLDYIFGSGVALEIFAGSGDGNFQHASFVNGNSYDNYFNAVAADFNGDSKLDLALCTGSLVWVLIGNGDATFSDGGSYSIGAPPSFITVGDLNADRKLDLAVTSNQGKLFILYGTGGGLFHPVQTQWGVQLATPYAADFNNDGRLDLLATRSTDGIPVVLLQTTTRMTLTSSPNPSVVGQPVTFSAFVQPVSTGDGEPSGEVRFGDGNTVLATSRLDSGHASFTTSSLSAGDHKITAIYSGDSVFGRNRSQLGQRVIH